MPNKESYKGIYAMHKYWGKKPFNEISNYIKKYTNPDDVILDSFSGSGVSLIEAKRLNRKAIGVDINPLAIKLSKVSLTNLDINEIEKTFNDIKLKVIDSMQVLYNTTCEQCHHEATITHIIWKNDKPIEVWYKCNYCNSKKIIRKGTSVDKKQSNEPAIKPLWYPNTKMFLNSRINVHDNQKVSDLFTHRALSALSIIYNEIEQIKNEDIRNFFEITFTGTVSQASKLVFVIRRRNKNTGVSKAEVGSWVVGYWVPEEHFEINAWNCFENRYLKTIKGQIEINSISKKDNKIASNYTDFIDKNCSTLILEESATNISIPDNSVDYVFIDPPHSNRIPYMEMSLMWNAWLRLDNECDWDDEIIVSESKERKKDKNNYLELMNKAISEVKRTLKNKKFFSFAFNSLDDNTWLDILNIFTKNNFDIQEVTPLEYSATSVIQDNRKNALKTDFVITCQLNKDSAKIKEQIIMDSNIEHIDKDIYSILVKNNYLETYQVINRLFEKTIPNGYIYPISKIIKELDNNYILNENKWERKGA